MGSSEQANSKNMVMSATATATATAIFNPLVPRRSMEDEWWGITMTTPPPSLDHHRPNITMTNRQDFLAGAFSPAPPPPPPPNHHNPTTALSMSSSPRHHDFNCISNINSDRRQKRMIKNRESATRSRARKQAYTKELELEYARVLKENKNLKRQYAELRLAMTVDTQASTKRTLQRSYTTPF